MQPRGRKHLTMGVGGAAVAAVALTLAACSSSGSPSGGSSSGTALSGTLNGSGSTFQQTFQEAAIQQFKSTDPGITVNYSAVGSGTGRTNLAGGTVNFAGSDSPIPSDEAANFKGKTVLYFPVLVGAITMSYNLSGVHSLKLTPTVIADIFQAKITKWNDPAIKAINPGLSLPSTPISLAVRSDSSGTTENFSLFLVKGAGSAWKLGTSSTINWPSSAHAGNGNSGVAQIVKSTPGAIGYVDLATAKASGLSYASVRNSAGSYVVPTPASASAAASGTTVAPNLTFAAAWAPGATSYPIAYQTWDLVYQKQSNASATAMLKAYLGYLLGSGQNLLTPLGYAKLPASIDSAAKAQLSKIGS